MQKSMAYWTDLSSVHLSDGTTQQWVHALPIGEYEHPVYGKLSFTADRIKRFAQSVKSKARGIDPDIDYDHKLDPSKGNAAAGWVKDAEDRADGLWLLVEWTKDAAKAINDKLYRYFSAEFLDEWKDPQGNVHKDVLLGGGLTNRPFMKNLVPINLSELVGLSEDNQEEMMDRKELAKLLGLSEEATEDQIKAKLTEVTTDKDSDTKIDLSKAEVTVGEDGILKVTHPDAEGEVTHKFEQTASKEEAELAKLAESNPAIAKMLSDQQELRQSMAQLETANRLSEVGTQLSDIKGADNKVLPPVAVTKFRDVMVKMPKALSDEVADALKELIKVGTVQLGETTGNRSNSGKQIEGNPVKKFVDEVDSVMEKDDKLSYREAVEKVSLEQPQLFAEYREAQAAGITLDD